MMENLLGQKENYFELGNLGFRLGYENGVVGKLETTTFSLVF